MKKVWITIFFASLFILLGTFQNKALGYLYLNNLDFDVQINEDASMDVTETWDIDIEETNTLFKTFKTDSTKYSGISNVNVVEVTSGIENNFEKINKLMYHVTKNCYYGMKNSDGDFEIAWGVGLDNDSGTRRYKISYTVEDAIGKYSDYAELYWQFVGKDFEVDAREITGKIRLPANVEIKDDIKVWGHTEDLNGEIYATSLNTIEFEINKFRSGRYVEVRSLFPTELIAYSNRTKSSNILDEAIKQETKWANEANLRRERRENLRKGATVLFAVIDILLSYIFLRKARGAFDKAKTTEEPHQTIDVNYFREIPRKNATPSQAVYAYKKTVIPFSSQEIGKVFSAILLDLSLKKHIEFHQDAKKNITIRILEKNPDELNLSEKKVLDFIEIAVGQNREITAKELEKYMKHHPTKIETIKTDIENESQKELINNGLYSKEREKERTKYASASFGYVGVILFLAIFASIISFEFIPAKFVLIGMAVLIFTAILNIIAVSKVYKKLNPFTDKGFDESAMWKGLKKYMEDFSLLKEREVPELAIWEEFLVYATAFGIADKVLKQLKIVYKDIYQNMDTNSYSYMYFMMNTNFSSSFSDAISSSVASSYTSTLSSGSGSGGGFSGGGGFGGGRRRRRRKMNCSIRVGF